MPTRIKKYLPWVVIGVLTLIIILYVFRRIPFQVGTSASEDRLKVINDSLMKEETLMKLKNERLMGREDGLKEKIRQLESNKETIKKYYETRIPIYDSYTPGQLEQYFTDRYERKN